MWNIYKGTKDSFPKEWSKYSQANLILLQEYLSTKKNKKLIESLNQDIIMGISYRLINDNTKAGVLNISDSYGTFPKTYHTPHREFIVGTPKASLITYYTTSNQQKLLVVNTHGINFGGLTAFKTQIKILADALKSHSGPIIWAGDFNTWSSKRLSYIKQITSELNMNQVLFSLNCVKRFLGKPLDHIFIRGLKVNEKQCFQSSGSDHNPQLVELKID